jgi:hypothetical protein
MQRSAASASRNPRHTPGNAASLVPSASVCALVCLQRLPRVWCERVTLSFDCIDSEAAMSNGARERWAIVMARLSP